MATERDGARRIAITLTCTAGRWRAHVRDGHRDVTSHGHRDPAEAATAVLERLEVGR